MTELDALLAGIVADPREETRWLVLADWLHGCHALDSLAESVQGARQQVSPLLNRATEQASAMAHRSLEAVRLGSQQLRDKALHATDTTASYIKHDPIKSVLIAAAAGAALMALVSLLSRSRNH